MILYFTTHHEINITLSPYQECEICVPLISFKANGTMKTIHTTAGNIYDFVRTCQRTHLYPAPHGSDVIMSVMASQITGVSIVHSIVCWGADQRNLQSSTSKVFVRGLHQSPVNPPHRGPVTRKMFPFDDVIMELTESAINDDRPYALICSIADATYTSTRTYSTGTNVEIDPHHWYSLWPFEISKYKLIGK